MIISICKCPKPKLVKISGVDKIWCIKCKKPADESRMTQKDYTFTNEEE